MPSEKTKAFAGVLIILALFILSSYIVRTNIEFFNNLIGNNVYGILVYILITIIAIVVAPISMMPLIPIISNVFGWVFGAIFTFIGWTIGTFIVFFLCRKYGIDLIKKFISLKQINKLESKIPRENLFIDIVLLRTIIPVDILSYALGLFSKVDFKTYALATMIGIIPFTIVFSYLGTVPLWYQVSGIILVVLLITTIHILRELKK
ncbi:MAG: TVP38/TMEM64 family protein [Nanoarchaeota archaeon]|nr:TVP38/TMEM64 family protein [Nanoarchaeota archaeon]